MTLATGEFIRRFLIHVLPKGLHRIRHYGLLANGQRAATIAKARELLAAPAPVVEPKPAAIEGDIHPVRAHPCPCCGGHMLIIEVFGARCEPKHQPTPSKIRIDTS